MTDPEPPPGLSPVTPEEAASASGGWRRLNARMIWVDAVQSVLSFAPFAVAVWVFGVDSGGGDLWPLLIVAAVGVADAARDALRWLVTRYRITDEHVERRSGLIVRRHRAVRRELIRTVDTTARLRHRLSGLRIVDIGAGQQAAAEEAAFRLDAVSRDEAAALRRDLLGRRPAPLPTSAPQPKDGERRREVADAPAMPADEGNVLARLRPLWVLHNILTPWTLVGAVGVLWGARWLLMGFGVPVDDIVGDLIDWEALGWVWGAVVVVAFAWLFGAATMVAAFFAEHWGFELRRVPGRNGTVLRTRQGLFRTREINRDDSRLRGAEIGEPLLLRWMGTADTSVISTGLDMSLLRPAAAVLPRGPVAVARAVTAEVIGASANPLDAELAAHPPAALRRRLVWATALTAGVVAVLAWLAAGGALPGWAWAAGVALWPVALCGAWVAHRALGHAVQDDYLVVRSGLFTRSTAALTRPAVSTVAIRESLLQRRLGLRTVSAMTAAGSGAYEAPDMSADEAVAFARRAAPGLLDPFLERRPAPADPGKAPDTPDA